MVAKTRSPKRTALTLLSFSNGQSRAVGVLSGGSLTISPLVATKYDVYGPSYGHSLHGPKMLKKLLTIVSIEILALALVHSDNVV